LKTILSLLINPALNDPVNDLNESRQGKLRARLFLSLRSPPTAAPPSSIATSTMQQKEMAKRTDNNSTK
jgi:hypothetical protein